MHFNLTTSNVAFWNKPNSLISFWQFLCKKQMKKNCCSHKKNTTEKKKIALKACYYLLFLWQAFVTNSKWTSITISRWKIPDAKKQECKQLKKNSLQNRHVILSGLKSSSDRLNLKKWNNKDFRSPGISVAHVQGKHFVEESELWWIIEVIVPVCVLLFITSFFRFLVWTWTCRNLFIADWKENQEQNSLKWTLKF